METTASNLTARFLRSWQEFRTKWYFKFVLPGIHQVVLEELRLDVAPLSLKARNRLLNVGYEIPEKLMCRDFLDPKDSVLEIGAAIGFIALFCQRQLGIREYLACEANPQTLQLLRRNYALNGVDSTTWNLALGPNNGQIELDVGSEFWENAVCQGESNGDGRKTITVPAATLDEIFRRANRRINVLIIDVEGAERFIDCDDIPDEVEKVIIELHPHLIGIDRATELAAGLTRRGFHLAREVANTCAFVRRAGHGAITPLLPEVCLSEVETNASPRNAPKDVRPGSLDPTPTPASLAGPS